MKKALLGTAVLLLTALGASAVAAPAKAEPKAATIVLVHGAFADSASWDGVISRLTTRGYRVIAAANPLRSVKSDADYVTRIVASVPGPVVLVGHSYGGNVISGVTGGNVKALVYVAGFAPEPGESAATLSGRFPGSTLGATLAPPIHLASGDDDVYIRQENYWQQFAADASEPMARQMAATQRPITQAALAEAADGPQLWKSVPSWFIYGSLDRNIPAAVHAFMGQRAKAREVIALKGASHALMVAHPAEVAGMIERAAAATAAN